MLAKSKLVIRIHKMRFYIKDFLVDGKPPIYKDFLDKGIVFVKDLFVMPSLGESFNYWKTQGLSQDLNTYLRWLGLRSSVKRVRDCSKLTSLAKEENLLTPIGIIFRGQEKNVASLTAKQYYEILKDGYIVAFPSMSSKLSEDFDLDDETLQSYYMLPHKITTEVKLKEFQYKVMNFLVNTNLLLKRKHLIVTDLCDFCQKEIENMYHLFYGCGQLKSFWQSLQEYWKSKTSEIVLLTLKDIILGNTTFPNILNYFILMAKYFIFKSKLETKYPNFCIFKSIILSQYEFEKYIAAKNQAEESFRSRWFFEP